jgi:NAD(P)-dependent dehydrogenase (short-subunit alcohol dehydrogenase family)
VALTATNAKNLAGVVGELQAAADVILIELNLREQTSIEAAVAKVIEHFGKIDVLVNNAGANLVGKAVDVTRADWESLFATNVTGTFFLTQQVGRHLMARGAPGRIITIASVQAFIGAAGRSAYGISKAALVQMTRMLAIEWAEYDITVNAVAPGRLDTQSPSRASTGSDPAYMEAMLKRIPLHRLATAEEVAGTVAFLASPAARTITGQTIVIDGGLSAA